MKANMNYLSFYFWNFCGQQSCCTITQNCKQFFMTFQYIFSIDGW